MDKILFVVLALATSCALAQYRWVDEKGRVQYTDTPPPPSAKGVQKKSFTPNTAAATKGADKDDKTAALMKAAAEKNPIKLYTISNCEIGCAEARKYLSDRGLPFTEVSVKTKEELEELKTVSGAEYVPVLRVGRRVHGGFDIAVYDTILDGAGYPK
jgi:glutaredoxin